ncbi:MAG: bifunctional folylpolyglutamate synthase/dihydrofolate synthase [Chitinophagaceae bacterium]|nr:bifunctional folylpolyglutamate synthase/dihydrofolate synthase [Chitinophagaceae bacterium]
MNYTETLDYLFTRLPMFSRTGAAALRPDLVNTKKICVFLGDPQNKIKTIHIAGTNGKGSCSHMLAAILQTCGYKTGLYTSPHLKDFRERIKVNGEMIPEDFIVDFTLNIMPLIDEIEPSFFEITVGMAFDYFEKEQVDVAVIETGLGGRLDSTNVITPELSVITNIGMDHMNLLGDTVELIAAEKAGIIKPYVPVVIGEHSYETEEVFTSIATKNKSPFSFADKVRYAAEWKYDKGFLLTDIVETHDDSHTSYQLDLPGYYQLKNLVTVCEAVHQLKLRGWKLPDRQVSEALKQVKKLTGLHGRWELIHHHPSVVLEVAHNGDGMQQVRKQIELSDYHNLHLVIGMVRDKDIDRVLELLPEEAEYYFTNAKIPRALPAVQLKERASVYGHEGEAYDDVNTAVKAAMGKAAKEDLIIVCGSVFVVGEVSLIHT